ncbi:hypothetical protein [Gimesia panareensis]|uniref:hypothetical protein n=1 Tax=Gimesia panareensis TaxID=2527978 RepID=UPI00118A34D9|nr:hypothetical protein [Gimesia panareensis]QDU51075.1 hypothetical protein Pan110_34370 [Gimesia panareensis]
MLRKLLPVIVLFSFALNGGTQARSEEQLSDAERAKRTRELSNNLRLSQKFMFHSGYLFIGDLASSHQSGKPRLPLTDNQEQTLKQLDQLLLLAKFAAMDRDADYLEDNPRDFESYLQRSKQRQRAAVRHGQQMTFTGLLSTTQTRYALQDYISVRKWHTFKIYLIQELLELTEPQLKQLKQAQDNYNKSTRPLFLGSMKPKADQKDIRAGINLYKEEYRRASLAILNPIQKIKYDQLKTRPPPIEVLPTTPPLTAADQQRLDLEAHSEIFRIIHQQQNQLNLTPKQIELLQQLILVTQRGLLWIETTQAEQPEEESNATTLFKHTLAEFLKHAEQVALQGILSEPQARQVLGSVY